MSEMRDLIGNKKLYIQPVERQKEQKLSYLSFIEFHDVLDFSLSL